MNIKVKIKFLTKQIYDHSYFIKGEELVLPFEEATKLVNEKIAVITHVY